MEHMLRQMDVKKNVLIQVKNNAAKLIQKMSRGFITRIRYENRHWAVILLQVRVALFYLIERYFVCFVFFYVSFCFVLFYVFFFMLCYVMLCLFYFILHIFYFIFECLAIYVSGCTPIF